MNPRIVLAIARKDVIDVVKNKNTIMALASPLIMAVFFLFMANLLSDNTDVNRTMRYYDPGNSGVVAALNEQPGGGLSATPAASPEEVRDAVSRKEAVYGLVVPAGYAEAIRAGQRPEVTVYFDASKSDGQTAARLAQGIQAYAMQLAGIQVPTSVQLAALNERPAGFQLRDLDLRNFYALFALMTAVISCGLYIMPNLLVEEKEKKTLRSLVVSPATFGEIITAKLLVGLLYTAIISVVVALINTPPVETLLLVAVGTLLCAIFFNLVGLFIGSVSEQMTTANAYIGVAFFLAFFPMLLVLMPFLDTSEGALGVILRAIPSFYFGDLFRIALQQTPDMAQFGITAGICAALIAAVALLSTWSLRRQRV